MEQIWTDFNTKLPLFLLVFLRMSGIFILSPIFGRRNIPNTLKVALTLLLTAILIPGLAAGEIPDTSNMVSFAFLCGKELLVGLILGYITTAFFSAFIFAGQIMDVQAGFGMAQIFDPQFNTQMPLLGNFMNVLALLAFFLLDGHHTLIKVLFSSFEAIPPGTAVIRPSISGGMADIFVMTFAMAVKVALPVMAAALLSEAALGIMVRAVPQMNVFVLGIPLKIFISLVVLLLFIPLYMEFLRGSFDSMFHYMEKALLGLRSG